MLGLYSNRVNKYGAYCSLFCGLVSLLGLGPIKDYLGLDISASMIGLITLAASVFVMYFGSFYGQVLVDGGKS